MTTLLESTLKSLSDSFIIYPKRDDDTQYFYLDKSNDHHEFLESLVYSVHDNGSVLPNDFLYDVISGFFNDLYDEYDSEKDIQDILENVTISPLIYNHDLLNWAGHFGHVIDDYMSEMGKDGFNSFFELLLCANGYHCEQIRSEIESMVGEYLGKIISE